MCQMRALPAFPERTVVKHRPQREGQSPSTEGIQQVRKKGAAPRSFTSCPRLGTPTERAESTAATSLAFPERGHRLGQRGQPVVSGSLLPGRGMTVSGHHLSAPTSRSSSSET